MALQEQALPLGGVAPDRTGKYRTDHLLVADMIGRGSKVLDVGCGDGELLQLLESRGIDGRGIELSREGVNRCVARGLAVVQGDADTDLVNYPDDAFDYVILSQTLQATRQPKVVLENLLRIGRRAVVSFPNFGFWKMRLQLLVGGHMPRTENLPATWYEILDGAEMNVRRVVPGRRQIFGARHLVADEQLQPHLPKAEIRERHDGAAADPQQIFQHHARLPCRLQRLRQDHIVEGVVGIIDEIGVGVALHHRETLGDAAVDTLARQFDAAPVNAPCLQQLQQITVAAADVEHLRAALDHLCHQEMIAAMMPGVLRPDAGQRQSLLLHGHDGFPVRPRAVPADCRNAREISKNSGTSSRNASWPRSVSISANDTRALEALSACTSARDSEVGNSQSLVNDTTQNRVWTPLKARASTPSWSAAMSK